MTQQEYLLKRKADQQTAKVSNLEDNFGIEFDPCDCRFNKHRASIRVQPIGCCNASDKIDVDVPPACPSAEEIPRWPSV